MRAMRGVQANQVEKKSKRYTDTRNDLVFITGRDCNTAVRPTLPIRTEDFGKTPESLIAHSHYLLVRDWDNPAGVKTLDLGATTYYEAVQAGFMGHYGEWMNNILAGRLIHGKVDKTPKKIRLRPGADDVIQEEYSEEE